MKKLLLTLLWIPLIFSCGEYNETSSSNNETASIDTAYGIGQLVLDFPSWSENIVFKGCDDILSRTPQSFGFLIYGDSIIDMKEFDSRLSILLKFNWIDGDVQSINIINDNSLTHTIELTQFLGVETFAEKDLKSKYYDKLVRDVSMIDINMDSYLDISVQSMCGKACYNSYFIYNPEKEIFEFSESFNYVRPVSIDCNNKILYSYDGGESYNMSFSAYKMENNKLELYQSLYQETGDDGSFIKIYSNANREIIHKKCWDEEGNSMECE